MKKKILFVITKSNFGGAQRYVFDLATSLPKEDFDVKVLCGGRGILKEKLAREGVATRELTHLGRDIHPPRDLRTFLDLYRIFREEKPDIVHLNSSKAGGMGALIARIALVPHIIFTAHAWAFNEPRNTMEKYLIMFLAWLTVILSHTTITVSQTLKKQISFLPFVRGKIVVIPNGVRTHQLYTREEARYALAKLHPALLSFRDTTEVWIGTVAELHPVKGLEYGIRALHTIIKTVPNVRYVISGEGDERKRLENLIRGYSLQNNVFLLGYVDGAERYGNAYDIFLLPSLSESFGISLLEAGEAKQAVVASATGGIPEIIDHEKNGILVEPRNVKDIATALLELIRNKEKRMLLGENLYHKVRTTYTLEKTITETMKLYNS